MKALRWRRRFRLRVRITSQLLSESHVTFTHGQCPPADARGSGAEDNSQMVKGEAYETGIGRACEVTAARKPVLRWKPA
jgi:hypothetical protein